MIRAGRGPAGAAARVTGGTVDARARGGSVVRAARRAVWGVLDQALSSATNFALSVAVARAVAPAQFGAFSVAFAAFLVALTIARSIATDPLTIRYSARETDAWREATARATGTSIAFGVVTGAIGLIITLVVGGDIGAALGPLSVGLPVMLLQDAWRFALFAGRRGRDAFLNDLVCAIVLGVAIVAIEVAGVDDVSSLVIAWVVSGTAGAAFGAWQCRVRPDARVRGWLREHLDIAPRLAIEGAILSGGQQLVLVVIGAVAGLASVASVRAAQVLLNALHVATYGLFLFAVPEGVRLLARSTTALLSLCVSLAGVLSMMTIAWGALLIALPDPWGRQLLGDTWMLARPLILPVTLMMLGSAIQLSAVVGLRALAAARRSLMTRIVTSGALFAGGVAGAVFGGAAGAASGMALAVLTGSLLWWVQLFRAVRAYQAGGPSVQAAPADGTQLDD